MPPARTYWPSSTDYKDAVFDAENSFADEELRRAEAVTDRRGVPLAWSGRSAVVFRLQSGEKSWAVKCLTRPADRLQERYRSLAEHLAKRPLPFLVKVYPYQEEGVLINGEWFPLIKMDWIEGPTLREIVRDNLSRPALLKQMCKIWLLMAQKQHEAEFTHCDLQHGNVLWVPGKKEGSLAVKLIDLDGSWIPTLAGHPSGEEGVPHYQHPERKGALYSREVDRFSQLVIYAALRCLAEGGRSLWQRFDRDENLLFTEEDYLACREDGSKSKPSELLQEFWGQGNEEVQRLAGWLTLAARGKLSEVPPLWEVISDQGVKPLEQGQIDLVQRLLQTRRAKAKPSQPKEIVNSIGMKLALIPAGKFLMGSPSSEKHRLTNEQQHEVEITNPFHLGVYQVTQGQWRKVMGSNPSWFCATGQGKDKVREMDTDDFPVEQVSWDDAQAFLKKLSELPDEVKAGRKYRLPTEAEWEYACRGGAPSYQTYHFGDSITKDLANYKDSGLERTCKVGSYQANGFGLYDMHGNVFEWCFDWFDRLYYENSPLQDPVGPARGMIRVIRGGNWLALGQGCRSAFRNYSSLGTRSHGLGFRVAAIPRE